MPKPTPERLPRNVIWLSIAAMMNDISGEIVQRGLPLFLSATLGVSKSVIGLIEGLADMAASLLQVFSGWYSDRWGNRKTIAGAGYTMTALARPMLYFATTWVLPLFSKFLDRAGKGIRNAPRDALIADSVSPQMRGRAFGLNRALDPAGAVLGALIGAGLLYYWQSSRFAFGSGGLSLPHWKTLMLVALIPSAIAALIVFFIVQEKKRERRTPPPLKHILHVGKDRRFRRLMLIVAFFTLGLSSDAFLVLRAQSLGIALWQIFVIIALFNLVTALSAYPAGILSDRLTRRALIRAGWIAYALIYVGFAFASEPWHIWTLYIVYGIYYGLTEGVEKAFVADLVAPEERGAAYGIYNGAVGIAALPASLIAGILWQLISPAAPFLFGGAIAVIATILLGTVKETKAPLP
ncbi:MAG: MFS transporter [Bacteroidota bacterium]|nr:MFS transporter [Bacteroidota bacterium]